MILIRVARHSKVFEVPNWHGFVGIDLHELRGSVGICGKGHLRLLFSSVLRSVASAEAQMTWCHTQEA